MELQKRIKKLEVELEELYIRWDQADKRNSSFECDYLLGLINERLSMKNTCLYLLRESRGGDDEA